MIPTPRTRYFCLSERSEESAFNCSPDEKQIPRFALNDNVFVLWEFLCQRFKQK
jgi:hypothetical protein